MSFYTALALGFQFFAGMCLMGAISLKAQGKPAAWAFFNSFIYTMFAVTLIYQPAP